MTNNKVLVLDNYDSFTYNLVQYIERCGYTVDVYRNDKIAIDDVAKYKIIVLSPGPGLPKDAGILMDVIKTYYHSHPILGVCLGMQAMGEVFGGCLINLDTVYHGMGTPINIIDKADPLYSELPGVIEVGRYHSWIVYDKDFPKSLIISARDQKGQIMSLRHKTYPMFGVQYHPESILTKHGIKIIENFLVYASNISSKTINT